MAVEGETRLSERVYRAKCRTCGWETRPLDGTTWNLPIEQARAGTGAHLRDEPDHDVGVVRVG